jgi:hypothetical protein
MWASGLPVEMLADGDEAMALVGALRCARCDAVRTVIDRRPGVNGEPLWIP